MDELVSKKLRDFRKKQGLTIAEFAEKLGFKSATGYAKIERNETDIRLKFLVNVCETFDAELSDFLGLNEVTSGKYTNRLEELLQLEQLQLNAISEFCKVLKSIVKDSSTTKSSISDLENRLESIIKLNQQQQLGSLTPETIISNGKYLDQTKLESLLNKIMVDNAALNYKVNKLLSNK